MKFVKKNDFEKNIIFVTHYVLISEVLDYAPSSGEIIVSDKDYKKANKVLKGIIHIHFLLQKGI